MRSSTKQHLKTLAELIAEEYLLPQTINSNEFLEIAYHVAEENHIGLSEQLINKYEADLKFMCSSLNEEDIFEEEEPKIEMKTVKGTIILYSDMTYEFVKPERNEVINPKVKIKDYSFFIEGEDGLIITKGTYKGHLIEEVDLIANFPAKKGWAKYMLRTDKDLTEDDREVFQKIILGQI